MQKYISNIVRTTIFCSAFSIISLGFISCNNTKRTPQDPISEQCLICTDSSCTNVVPCSSRPDLIQVPNELTLVPACQADGKTLHLTFNCSLGSSFGISTQSIQVICNLNGGEFLIEWDIPTVPLCGKTYVMDGSSTSCQNIVQQNCKLLSFFDS